MRIPSPLTDKLSEAVYDVTQGITDFAVKVYILAQIRAIVTDLERVTPAIIRSVAADSLRLATPVLEALRRRDCLALQTVEDIYLDLDSLITRETGACVAAAPATMSAAPIIGEERHKSLGDPPAETSQPDEQDVDRGNPRVGKKDTAVSRSSLLDVMASQVQGMTMIYEALQQAGYTRSANEFLNLDIQP